VRDKWLLGSFSFTSSVWTYTSSFSEETKTGSYAYDSNKKWVWLKTATVGGKNQSAYYSAITVPSNHGFSDDNTYRAAKTNQDFDDRQVFLFGGCPTPYGFVRFYNSTNKTIGDW